MPKKSSYTGMNLRGGRGKEGFFMLLSSPAHSRFHARTGMDWFFSPYLRQPIDGTMDARTLFTGKLIVLLAHRSEFSRESAIFNRAFGDAQGKKVPYICLFVYLVLSHSFLRHE